MVTPWDFHTLPSIDCAEAVSREMDWDEAQLWCNFVLMQPQDLPNGLSVRHAAMRPEAPPGRVDTAGPLTRPDWTLSNRACHRAVLSDGVTQLRVKQFLYDWAAPAFDHPSLWRSQPPPRSFTIGDDVGWLGKDFRRRPAAALQLDRTTIELAVTEGHLDDDVLVSLCRSFRPASSDARDRIVATSLASLSYASRHREPVVEVPTGYWRYQRDQRKLIASAMDAAAAPDGLPGQHIAPAARFGFTLNSVFLYHAVESGELVEAEFVYEVPGRPGRYLRVMASWSTTSGGVPYPPVLDEQTCDATTLEGDGAAVYHAYLERAVGPHEAVLQKSGQNIIVLCKPTAWTSDEWFQGLLADLGQ